MQLPKYKKLKRIKLKICQEPSCGIEFWGHPIAKYCKQHMDIRNRVRRRRKYENPDIKNQVFKHKFYNTADVEFTCHLKGCKTKFMVKIFPKQYIYPKYCPEHRTEHRRIFFARMNP